MNKYRWRERLRECRTPYELERMIRRHSYLFSPEDNFWIKRAGVDAMPRILDLCHQELRAMRGLPYYDAAKGDPAAPAVRRVMAPALILRR